MAEEVGIEKVLFKPATQDMLNGLLQSLKIRCTNWSFHNNIINYIAFSVDKLILFKLIYW